MKRNVIRRKPLEPKSGTDAEPDPRDGGVQSVDRALSITSELTTRAQFRTIVLDILRSIKGGKSLATFGVPQHDGFIAPTSTRDEGFSVGRPTRRHDVVAMTDQGFE